MFLSNPHIPQETKRTAYSRIATGGGKTVVFGTIINSTRSVASGSTLKTLVVVPTSGLITQTKKEFAAFFPELDVRIVDENHKEYGGKEVTLTTYDSFMLGVENGKFKPDSFGLLVLDEAHNALALGASEVVKKFKKSIIRGYTATPEYHDEKSLSHFLGYEICNIPAPELVEVGRLSSFKSVLVHSTKHVDLNAAGFGTRNYKRSQLEKAINCEAVINTAIDLYMNYRDPETGDRFFGKKLRLNCVGVDHANDAANAFHEVLKDRLPENLMPSVAIHSDVEKGAREEINEQRLEGKYLVTSQVKCLDEGDNDPSLEIIFNLAPTASKVRAEQRGGRVLRLHPEDPAMMKYVVDFTFDGPKPQHPPVLFAEVMDAILINNPQRQARSRGPEEEERVGYNTKIPDFPPYTVSATIEELATFLQHYKAAQPKELVEVTEETRQKLINEKIRTGVGARKLLSGREDVPARLNFSMITNWQAGTVRKAFKEHVEYTFKVYAGLPTANKKIQLTSEMAAHLENQIERTGIGLVEIGKQKDKPDDFKILAAFRWRTSCTRGLVREVPEHRWNWLITKYASFPNDPRPRISVTAEMIAKASREMERTGYGVTTVLSLPNAPDKLEEGIIINFLKGKSKTIVLDYYTWLVDSLAVQPDTSKIKITDEKILHLNAERRRTGIGLRKLFKKANKPDGLTEQMASQWFLGHVKTAQKIHYDFTIAAYAELPDASPPIKYTAEMHQLIAAERRRTGLGLKRLVNISDNPHDFDPNAYSALQNEKTNRQTIDKNVWEWLLRSYGAQSSIVTPEKKAKLAAEMKRTGVGLKRFWTLYKDRLPEGLTNGILLNWAGKIKTSLSIPEKFFNPVLEFYRTIPTKPPEIRIAITDQMKEALLAERKRTGVAFTSLKGPDLPADLDPVLIHTWTTKVTTVRTVNKAHYEAVMRHYFSLPTVIKIPITNERRSYLVKEFERTGVGPVGLLKNAQDIPEGLTPEKIQDWKTGHARYTRADHYGYVEAKYASLGSKLGHNLSPLREESRFSHQPS